MSKICTFANIALGALVITFAGCEKANQNTAQRGQTAINDAATTTADNTTAEKPPTPVAATTAAAVTLATTGPMSDPHKGKFTLEQATEGLEGKGKLIAEITTEFGKITCTLFADRAPQTVASFVGLARGKRAWEDPYTHVWQQGIPFFDGLAFHRVIPSFMIQGGDPRSRDYNDRAIGTGSPGYRVPDEINKNTKFTRGGLLAMANSGPGTNSGGSQFFITEGPRHSLDGGYTIFGQCDAMDVVKTIARQPVRHPNKPLTPITMQIAISR